MPEPIIIKVESSHDELVGLRITSTYTKDNTLTFTLEDDRVYEVVTIEDMLDYSSEPDSVIEAVSKEHDHAAVTGEVVGGEVTDQEAFNLVREAMRMRGWEDGDIEDWIDTAQSPADALGVLIPSPEPRRRFVTVGIRCCQCGTESRLTNPADPDRIVRFHCICGLEPIEYWTKLS